MAAPPTATSRWNAIRSSVTAPLGDRPSKVAALMIRFFRVIGPRRADPKTARPDSSPASALAVTRHLPQWSPGHSAADAPEVRPGSNPGALLAHRRQNGLVTTVG